MSNMYIYGLASSSMNVVFLDKLFNLTFNPFIYPITGMSLGIGFMIIGKLHNYNYVNYNNIKYLFFSNVVLSTIILPILLHKYLI